MEINAVNHIKDVAIYLRKSRGQEEDLDKHREELVELCEKNGWRYVEYGEIGSSQKLMDRPELSRLLKDIQEDMYDAVVVMDKDRLSREGVGQAQINKILAENDCLIVTPTRVYDLTNESDMMVSEFEDLMARFEYRAIVKRLKRGKRRGAKQGKWTNGTPPIPYIYNPKFRDKTDKSIEKGEDLDSLIVDEEKLEIYRFIVDSFLNGMSPYTIAWELNKRKIASPRGSTWNNTGIRRLLKDETHLGRIIANKTTGSKKRLSTGRLDYKVNKREDWIIVENCHKAVKTKEEHEKILIEMQKRKRDSYATTGENALSGLIVCSKCGATMAQKKSKIESERYSYVEACKNFLEDGITKCDNHGGSTMYLMKEIERQLVMYRDDIEKENERVSKGGGLTKTIESEKKKKEERIIELEDELEQVTTLALAKFFTPEEAVQQKKKILDNISKLESELYALNLQTDNLGNMTRSEKVNAINKFLEVMDMPHISNSDLNRLYKTIIHSIIWDKSNPDELKVTINFL
ncbi:hypothetical protein BAOM_2927 [Peribacillus asahii]|uniref:Recombinase family protein n=1 Tax=Peribacillus asahii TaxID=228899 RepID=A0A3Q9RP45_9BACI|nr:recombinase family protein [Peribacillus asahii]AZV43536.1 hypothetical protein BAOM_2927 [Peribacillus asahii]